MDSELNEDKFYYVYSSDLDTNLEIKMYVYHSILVSFVLDIEAFSNFLRVKIFNESKHCFQAGCT